MNQQEKIDFDRIATAIEFIKTNFKSQPNLEEIAQKMNINPFHFQRLFSDWAGISPKKFLQFTSIEYAKNLLKAEQTSLFETALETGLSGSGRLHDLFVNIEGMTPGEYKNGGENLEINYSFSTTIFGDILIASTQKGICYMAFLEEKNKDISILKNQFPNAKFQEQIDEKQRNALSIFSADWSEIDQIKLHLKGTDFQLKVWQTLLKIPFGNLATYGNIANKIEKPNASRAVGTAIGSNPVAFLIPCHRVIQASGKIGGYMWGNTRKTAIIAWEGAKK